MQHLHQTPAIPHQPHHSGQAKGWPGLLPCPPLGSSGPPTDARTAKLRHPAPNDTPKPEQSPTYGMLLTRFLDMGESRPRSGPSRPPAAGPGPILPRQAQIPPADGCEAGSRPRRPPSPLFFTTSQPILRFSLYFLFRSHITYECENSGLGGRKSLIPRNSRGERERSRGRKNGLVRKIADGRAGYRSEFIEQTSTFFWCIRSDSGPGPQNGPAGPRFGLGEDNRCLARGRLRRFRLRQGAPGLWRDRRRLLDHDHGLGLASTRILDPAGLPPALAPGTSRAVTPGLVRAKYLAGLGVGRAAGQDPRVAHSGRNLAARMISAKAGG